MWSDRSGVVCSNVLKNIFINHEEICLKVGQHNGRIDSRTTKEFSQRLSARFDINTCQFSRKGKSTAEKASKMVSEMGVHESAYPFKHAMATPVNKMANF
jgi:hypothetical protein